MVIFYDKKTGEIYATIDGRVHDEKTIECTITDSTRKEKDIGKMVIGWEEKGKEKIEHNLDHFEILQDIEDDKTPTRVSDFKVKNNKLEIMKALEDNKPTEKEKV
jgi:hypothetical protein